jgi:hypothetical protein
LVWRQFIISNIYNAVPSAVAKTFGLAMDGDAEAFNGALAELVNGKLSYFDLDGAEPEKTYHVFMLGLLAASGIHVVSNREKGRWDVTALLPDKSVIFEFKRTKRDAQLRRAAKAACRQIVDKRYADGAPEALPVWGVGVGFCGKACAVTSIRVR